jgi:hypothetical protein
MPAIHGIDLVQAISGSRVRRVTGARAVSAHSDMSSLSPPPTLRL